MNSTKPTLTIQWQKRLLETVALLPFVFCHPAFSQEMEPQRIRDDRLSSADEDFAYATKRPTDRVAAFLKIANRKIDAAKRIHKLGSFEDMTLSLCGYSSAIEGAFMAVAWGEDLGADMHRQEATIRKTIGRHRDILNKMQHPLPSESLPPILKAKPPLESAEVARPLH